MTAEWVQPGAAAVILQPYGHGALRAESVTIERVLKRDVVLSNGDRFNKDSPQRQVGGSYGLSYYLVPPDDPRVVATRAAIRERNERHRAITAFEAWQRGKGTADAVLAAFAPIAAKESGKADA